MGTHTEPAVSVICHTYNHVRFIEAALRGFLDQETSFPFEVLIHDDASDDGTTAVVRRWAESYPTVIRPILQTVNQYSRGKKLLPITMPHARGRYIALCEGDDFWTDPRKLQIQFDFLESNLGYVACYHDISPLIEERRYTKDTEIVKLKVRYQRDCTPTQMSRLNCDIRTPTIFFRNVLPELPDEYNRARGGDRFLVSLLGEYGGGKYLQEIGPSCYRVHSGGVSSGVSSENRDLDYVGTNYWMHIYYKRIGNDVLSEFFGRRSVEFLLGRIYGTKPVPKLGAKLLFPKAADIFRSVKSRLRRSSR